MISKQPKTNTNILIHKNFDRNCYSTPQYVYDFLNKEFNFIGDLAAEPSTAKHSNYITKEQNSLSVDWHLLGNGYLFINPPYKPLKPWIAKAQEEAKLGAKIVMLVPADVSTTQLFQYLPSEIRFIVGRLSFLANNIEIKGNMHSSCLLIWDGRSETSVKWITRDSMKEGCE